MKKYMLQENKNKGIGLLELMLSLAIIAVLITMVTLYFKPTSQAKNINIVINTMQAIQSAGQRWLLTSPTYSKDPISDFVDRGYLPSDFRDKIINPWGGDITVTGYQGGTSNLPGPWLHVEITNIPSKACNALKEQAAVLTCDNTSDYINCSAEQNSATSTFRINLPSECPVTTP